MRRILGSTLKAAVFSVSIAFSAPAICAVQAGENNGAQLAQVSSCTVPYLKQQIDTLLEHELLPFTNAGIKIISLRQGDTLYEHNAQLLLIPASNQKIFTAATALALLGKDREVTTSVALDETRGTIYLKGCGDSMLSAEDLVQLAASAARRLDRNKHYALSADLACFDDLYWGKGWMWDDEPDTDEMYISPLSVDLNGVTVVVKPGTRKGQPAYVALLPATSLASTENHAVTGAPGDAGSITVTRRPGDRDNLITVSGIIPAGTDPIEKRLSVWQPEMLALGVFRDALRAQGIRVTGASRATTPAESIVIGRKTRRVGEMVKFTLKRSDNLASESLLKLLAYYSTRQPGTAEAGSAEVRGYLETKLIQTRNLVIADGSGVSRYNLSNAETITHLLREIYRDQGLYPIFHDGLPVAGRDGTLATRMKGTAAEGNLRGKTGNMNGVSALSGYVSTAEGEPLAFSIIIQNFAGTGAQVRDLQDRIGALLSGFRRR